MWVLRICKIHGNGSKNCTVFSMGYDRQGAMLSGNSKPI